MLNDLFGPPARRTLAMLAVLAGALTLPGAAFAQEPAGVSPEVAYILNSFLFLVAGFLVMFMAAGFCMLEAGMVRSKNVATICVKNIALYSVAGLMYFLLGYNLMYSGVDGGWIGSFGTWSADDSLAASGDFSGNYAASSDWFFQMVFVATAASIVSGTLAERIRLWPFLIFVVVLTGIIYPIQGAWKWGGGWLGDLGFADFAGSTIVHSVGGWAALTGAIILGPRRGKYAPYGRVHPMPASSLPLAALGTFILWLGWFGFNGGSQLALGSGADAVAIANIFANTNTAAAAGVLTAMVLTQILYGKVDLTMALNGALAGLVSITAAPDTPSLFLAALIGAIGASLVVVVVPVLDRLRIDDVVGAIPVHLVAGIWGTIAVAFSYQAEVDGVTLSFFGQVMIQLLGILVIGVFVTLLSTLSWLALRFTIGIRADPEEEATGLDVAELGMEAYPEFAKSTA
ncbi:MAG: ammonium transporter [Alphaproteobacteria bacterium]